MVGVPSKNEDDVPPALPLDPPLASGGIPGPATCYIATGHCEVLLLLRDVRSVLDDVDSVVGRSSCERFRVSAATNPDDDGAAGGGAA